MAWSTTHPSNLTELFKSSLCPNSCQITYTMSHCAVCVEIWQSGLPCGSQCPTFSSHFGTFGRKKVESFRTCTNLPPIQDSGIQQAYKLGCNCKLKFCGGSQGKRLWEQTCRDSFVQANSQCVLSMWHHFAHTASHCLLSISTDTGSQDASIKLKKKRNRNLNEGQYVFYHTSQVFLCHTHDHSKLPSQILPAGCLVS